MYENNLSRSTKRILALPSGKSDIQFFIAKTGFANFSTKILSTPM